MVVCTKLVQWLTLASLILGVWSALLTRTLPISSELYEAIVPLPVYLIMCFGCYSLFTIGYRLMSFNDCNDAASELMGEIKEARRDLTSKGIKL
ncbi:dolichol-phosphate mannosyltransferase subunit 3-like [Halichondria panicea]|uniref:dolichol-phosphate mannosyltransferase subunit 3-like n=1 Tax=Halichondria panicea TaxID=6063 RepID=UPI00312BC901